MLLTGFYFVKSVVGCRGTGNMKYFGGKTRINIEGGKVTELLHGHFRCQAEFSYHWNLSSLKYHLNAKHTVDRSRQFKETDSLARLRQTTINVGRSTDEEKQDKLTNVIAQRIATDCRLTIVEEDVSLRNIMRLAINNCVYVMHSRRTITRKIHELYEKERAAIGSRCCSYRGLLDLTR